MVDFFCDPAGQLDRVDTVLVNKRQGYNAYFPMPFRKSARVVLAYEGDQAPGQELFGALPCYSYVMWRKLDNVPADQGYFHASWRQQPIVLGREDYVALDATGKGKFTGWNFTIRQPGRGAGPVDMNAKFFVDGEQQPSVELMGIEDSVGFSWGFPPTDNEFPFTGFHKYLDGAMAYRFFLSDAISFTRDLKVRIGFGEHEHPMFREMFGNPANTLEIASTVYWYQTEPHLALPVVPSVAERAPAPEDNPVWPGKEVLPTADELKARGARLEVLCGRKKAETLLADEGYSVDLNGYSWQGFPPPVYHTRADNDTVKATVHVPKGATGTLRLYFIDPDSFGGGRHMRLTVDGQTVGEYKDFQKGQWVEVPIAPAQTGDGVVEVALENLRKPASNAVLSILEWVAK